MDEEDKANFLEKMIKANEMVISSFYLVVSYWFLIIYLRAQIRKRRGDGSNVLTIVNHPWYNVPGVINYAEDSKEEE